MALSCAFGSLELGDGACWRGMAGDTTTYPEVLSGVDLRVTAEVDGFSEVLVTKTPAAARNPALRALRWKVSAAGVSLRQVDGGSQVATDRSGAQVFSAPPPTMWDLA